MDDVIDQIKEIAMKYKSKKVVLFGSRARGDNSPVSDYDIAFFDENLTDIDKACISADIEDINTLKKVDIVFEDAKKSNEFIENIKKDGVIIYEQI